MREYFPDDFRLDREGSADRWYVFWSEGRRTRRRSMGTADKGLARERMKHFVAQMCAPNKAESDQLLMSFVLNQYWDDVASTAASTDTAKRVFEHLLAYHANHTVAEINKKANKKYEKEMREKNGWSNSTINRYRSFLRAALEHAVENEDLAAAPIVPTLPEPPAKDRWFTRKEAAALLRAVKPQRWYYMRLFILIGLYTGARHEAILSLRWEQIDFENGTIDFRRRDAKGALLPQTKKRRPYAPQDIRLMRFLKYAYDRELRRAKKQNRDVIAFVVHHRGGQLLSVKKAYREACARAKVTNVTPHTMKHTRITWLLRARVPAWQVSGLTATSLATIERVYGHHIQEDLAQAASAVRTPRTHLAPISNSVPPAK